MCQLELNFKFSLEDEVEYLKKELAIVKSEMKAVRESSDKVRKGIYAKHNELAKLYIYDLNPRVDLIEKNICTSIK